MRIGVNTAIVARGHSGTATVTRLIIDVLRGQGHEVVDLAPQWRRGRWRALNLWRSLSWDLYAAGRQQPLDLLVSPCNVGLAPSGTPHLLYLQDVMPLDHPELFDPWFNLYVRAMFSFSARHATVVVTASSDSASRMRQRWPKVGDRIRVAPWPVRSPVVAGPRELPDGLLTVVQLGVTEPHKRTALGIQVVDRLRRTSGRDVRLQVIGPPGRAEPEVQAAIATHDPGGGWVSRFSEPTDAGVRRRLESAWLLLQCSSDEGFGLPLVEAAAVALPVVHTGAGSMAEVAPYGVTAGDLDGLTAAVAALLDPDAYRAASVAALEVAARHSLEAFSRRLAELVAEAVAR